ncbi:hypothetical protein BX661DRAFT_184501 [Kickxella alabastrina]|uniref:uncharacterized protein n=1 Tax=Kickxella alabastrina TaxID=61397 RepID=UPI00221EA799|nr:uncharacterized protein BX661DRAFT_184501 [Kickxella alabastrina]KAI7825418.1 hypothetical protein BX661DRAFT_184501 [Kickxella alabastrina]
MCIGLQVADEPYDGNSHDQCHDYDIFGLDWRIVPIPQHVHDSQEIERIDHRNDNQHDHVGHASRIQLQVHFLGVLLALQLGLSQSKRQLVAHCL